MVCKVPQLYYHSLYPEIGSRTLHIVILYAMRYQGMTILSLSLHPLLQPDVMKDHSEDNQRSVNHII